MDAAAFAHDWIEAWNTHDIERVLSHYADDVVLISPRVREMLGEASGAVRGKQALRQYFSRGLARRPDLHFAFEAVDAGVDSIVLRYLSYDDRKVSELMVFDPEGLVHEVRAHWNCEHAD